MITNLTIENFRGLKSIMMDGLKRMTLISGKNNIGKSSILEALFLLMDHTSQQSFAKLCSSRGAVTVGVDNLWEPLFYDMDTDLDIKITIVDSGIKNILRYKKDEKYLPLSKIGLPDDFLTQLRTATKNSYSLKIEFEKGKYRESGHFSTDGRNILADLVPVSPMKDIQHMKPTRLITASSIRIGESVVEGIGSMILAKKKGEIIKILQKLDPVIDDLEIVTHNGITQLYIRQEGNILPLRYAGDGIIKLLNIGLAIKGNKNSLVLIDELETGFHYSMYEKLWNIIDEISYESNCQIIATTHSYELIDAVIDGLVKKEDFAYFRIGKSKDGIAAYDFDYDLLSSALKSEMEVR